MFFVKQTALLAVLFLSISGAHAFGVKKKPEAPKEVPMGVSSPANGQVWVKKPDGGLACDADKKSVTPLEVGKAELKKAGIEVFEAKKANDGLMHAAVCGIATGNENHFLISAKDAEKAKKLGYELTK